MITAIIGLFSPLIGGLVRLAPEILKFFDKKNDRSHELAMQHMALEFEKQRGANRMAELGAEMQITQLDAIGRASAAQMRKTGIRWVDAVNALVRPLITYWFAGLYGAIKICALIHALQDGGNLLTALPAIWDSEVDTGILGSILGFWFVSRVYEKRAA